MELTKEFLEAEYLRKGKSTWQIARECGFQNSKSIWWKMKRFNIPIRTRSEAFLLNHPTRKRFNPIFNESLSYIIGVILGDGNVRHYLVRLRTITLSFNKSFEKALKNIGLESKTVFISARNQWNTYVCSVEFASWIKNLTFMEIERITMKTKKDTIAFIRGFYESEGSAKKWYKVVYVLMTNSNRELLKLLEKLILSLGFKTTIYENFDKRRNSYIYRLHILGSSEEKLKFLKLIKPCIKSEPRQYPLNTPL